MIPAGNSQPNIERFLGFQEDYDRYRPEAPLMVTQLLTAYLGQRPGRVADVGCGTGLSTFIWKGAADAVIGIEPNPDMRGKAEQKLAEFQDAAAVSFAQGYSNQLPFDSDSVDIVTCSQSFHWMEPVSTLSEFARVLREGGVFAAYDCDWPLVLQADVELLYNRLIDHTNGILDTLVPASERAHKWDKEGHLGRIAASGHFRFSREVVFHHMEACDAERYVGLALSQGGIQTVWKLGSRELDEEIAAFRTAVEGHFGGRTLDVPICYRMRLGVK